MEMHKGPSFASPCLGLPNEGIIPQCTRGLCLFSAVVNIGGYWHHLLHPGCCWAPLNQTPEATLGSNSAPDIPGLGIPGLGAIEYLEATLDKRGRTWLATGLVTFILTVSRAVARIFSQGNFFLEGSLCGGSAQETSQPVPPSRAFQNSEGCRPPVPHS